MSLLVQAEADLAVTLEAPGDFGNPVTVTDPDGFQGTEQLHGRTTDIGQLIDPDTGQGVSGRHASCTLRMASLTAAGFTSLPVGIADATGKPWLVAFAGVSTPLQTYKVSQSRPDRALGVVVMILEAWNG